MAKLIRIEFVIHSLIFGQCFLFNGSKPLALKPHFLDFFILCLIIDPIFFLLQNYLLMFRCSEKVGKSWDQWFIEKTLAKMEAMQLTKKAEEEKIQTEIKEQEEKQRRLQQVQLNRREWVKKKTYKIRKENNEKLAQEEFERLKVIYFIFL